MNPPTDPRDAEARVLAQALREQAQQEATPDVSDPHHNPKPPHTPHPPDPTHHVQVLLFGALLAAAAWYFWL